MQQIYTLGPKFDFMQGQVNIMVGPGYLGFIYRNCSLLRLAQVYLHGNVTYSNTVLIVNNNMCVLCKWLSGGSWILENHAHYHILTAFGSS